MAGSSNFWTPSLKGEFHGTVDQLRRLTEIPSKVRYYRDDIIPAASSHVLAIQDELQISDDLAFLCHWDEGALKVAAVTLQEHPNRLVVLLACNQTPDETTRHSLDGIMAIVSEYASQKRNREIFCDRLFRNVLKLSRSRILARIRPLWLPEPPYVKTRRDPPQHKKSLQDKIRFALDKLKSTSGATKKRRALIEKVKELVDCLDPLNKPLSRDETDKILGETIKKCVEIATYNQQRSFRSQLISLNMNATLYDAPEVQQIDKLARYYFLCKDFIRIARKSEYDTLFKRIEISYTRAFEGINRPIIKRSCFVHAEIQQVLYYEKHPHEPRPRVIGCSKSACYLCDLFVQTQGLYILSHAHRRLYDRWTIPDVNWMTTEQVGIFRSIIREMVKDLQTNIHQWHQNKDKRSYQKYPLESMAFLPLSSGSTVSAMRCITARQEIRETTSIPDDDVSHKSQVVTQEQVEETFATPDNKSSSTDTGYVMCGIGERLPGSDEQGQQSNLIPAHGETRKLGIDGELLTSLRITKDDLPFLRTVRAGDTLNIEIDRLSLSLDFTSITGGDLAISRLEDPAGCTVIPVFDIPTCTEMQLQFSKQSSQVEFCTQLEQGSPILVSFSWS
ncbi:hypothetical protein F4778DRAFT_71790 [Xylariomycetidae sp. FL2044]|nr:hypothetical protein F4778DRAFT_71790 [Xylariomycetidae sp. FL2044]